MRYNSILDKAPEEYFGVRLNTDFKNVLKFLRIVDSPELDDNDKTELTIKLFVLEVDDFSSPENIGNAIEKHISGPGTADNEGGRKSFDFNQDHGLILAAFRQIYNIDLRTAKLHWWEFLELFGAVPENTHLMKVIEIRNKDIPKKGDAKYIRNLRKLKRLYSLENDDDKADRVQGSIARMMVL